MMKRFSLLSLLAVSVGLLGGCPIYDDVPGGTGSDVGGSAGTTTPAPGSCLAQTDCTGASETCGEDGFCHIGDCTIWGCVGEDVCRIKDQKASCQPPGSGAGGASVGGAGGESPAGGASVGGAGGASPAGGASMGGAGGASSFPTGGASPAGGAGGASPAGGAGGASPAGGSGGAPGGGAGGQGGMP